MDSSFLNIHSYGLHSCLSTSLIKVQPFSLGLENYDLAIYSRNNKLILFDFISLKRVDQRKICEELIVCIK